MRLPITKKIFYEVHSSVFINQKLQEVEIVIGRSLYRYLYNDSTFSKTKPFGTVLLMYLHIRILYNWILNLFTWLGFTSQMSRSPPPPLPFS